LTAPGSPSVLDHSMIEELRGLDDGQGAVLAQLVQLFVGGAPERLAAMQAALAQGDFEQLSRHAHSLKSSAANLGAARMAACCQRLEDAGRSPAGREQAAGDLEALGRECASACAELKLVPQPG